MSLVSPWEERQVKTLEQATGARIVKGELPSESELGQRALTLLREALDLDSRNDLVLELLGHLAARVAPRHDALAVFRHLLERYRWTGVSAPTALDRVACLLATTDPNAAATLFGAVDARGVLTSSMQRDVAAGREPELDAIAGAVLRAASRHDLACPTVDRLARRILGTLDAR